MKDFEDQLIPELLRIKPLFRKFFQFSPIPLSHGMFKEEIIELINAASQATVNLLEKYPNNRPTVEHYEVEMEVKEVFPNAYLYYNSININGEGEYWVYTSTSSTLPFGIGPNKLAAWSNAKLKLR